MEYTNLKLKQLLEAPKLTPDEQKLIHIMQLHTKQLAQAGGEADVLSELLDRNHYQWGWTHHITLNRTKLTEWEVEVRSANNFKRTVIVYRIPAGLEIEVNAIDPLDERGPAPPIIYQVHWDVNETLNLKDGDDSFVTHWQKVAQQSFANAPIAGWRDAREAFTRVATALHMTRYATVGARHDGIAGSVMHRSKQYIIMLVRWSNPDTKKPMQYTMLLANYNNANGHTFGVDYTNELQYVVGQ